MPTKRSLSKTMSVGQSDNSYWYAVELKAFAKAIGIPSAQRLRKDELEISIKKFLKTRNVQTITTRRLSKSHKKDCELGLRLDLQVVNYSDTKKTKVFIDQAALSLDPDFTPKSGARYRLNRWREEQLNKDKKITYGDLAMHYVELCRTKGSFEQVPHGRYINFLSDFLASNKKATHKDAREAWKKLKILNVPKDYASWVRFRK